MAPREDKAGRVFKALADPTRRRIVEELATRENQSLFEIYTRVVTAHGSGHSRQAFSRHLAVLEQAGLIDVEWQGVTKLHTLNPKPIAGLMSGWLSQFAET